MSRFCCYAIIVSVAGSGSAAGQSTPRSPSSAVRSVRLDKASPPGTATVVVESNGGPLPEPESGAPLNPPRIYLDFAGVLATTVVQPESDPIVSRIRVAEHTASPLVTRVVVNLNKPMPYRIDASARTQGRVVLIIGGEATDRTLQKAGAWLQRQWPVVLAGLMLLAGGILATLGGSGLVAE